MKEDTTVSKVPAADKGVPGVKGASSIEQIHNLSTSTHVEGA
jgi:hypothetical protein